MDGKCSLTKMINYTNTSIKEKKKLIDDEYGLQRLKDNARSQI